MTTTLRIASFALALSACLGPSDGSASPADGAATSTVDGAIQNSETLTGDTAAEPNQGVLDAADTRPTDPADTQPVPADTLQPTADTAAPSCLATSAECRQDTDCCSGICTYMGVYAVDSGCIDPLPLGADCAEDNWCASGFCVNGRCTDGACFEEGADCSVDPLRCCETLFCSWTGGYAPSACEVLRTAGQGCYDATWCLSGMCGDDGLCR